MAALDEISVTVVPDNAKQPAQTCSKQSKTSFLAFTGNFFNWIERALDIESSEPVSQVEAVPAVFKAKTANLAESLGKIYDRDRVLAKISHKSSSSSLPKITAACYNTVASFDTSLNCKSIITPVRPRYPKFVSQSAADLNSVSIDHAETRTFAVHINASESGELRDHSLFVAERSSSPIVISACNCKCADRMAVNPNTDNNNNNNNMVIVSTSSTDRKPATMYISRLVGIKLCLDTETLRECIIEEKLLPQLTISVVVDMAGQRYPFVKVSHDVFLPSLLSVILDGGDALTLWESKVPVVDVTGLETPSLDRPGFPEIVIRYSAADNQRCSSDFYEGERANIEYVAYPRLLLMFDFAWKEEYRAIAHHPGKRDQK